MIIQYLLLAICALILVVSCIRAPKNALLVHLIASPMWAVVALTIYYGWEAAATAAICLILVYVAMPYISNKFLSRETGKLFKKFYKTCKESLRHFANSALWLISTGPLMLATAAKPGVSKMLSKFREKREGGGAK